MVLVGGDGGELGLREQVSLEVLGGGRQGVVLAPGGEGGEGVALPPGRDVYDVQAWLVPVHGIQNHLKNSFLIKL